MRGGVFITATGTEVGKTWISRGLARSLRRRGVPLRAIKPFETGVDPVAEDAEAIARAAGHPAIHRGLYRARAPLSPLAITLRGEHEPAIMKGCLDMIQQEMRHSYVIVEGAGGVLVPIDDGHTMADFGLALELPVLVVADDRLGTLSHTACALEAATRRGPQVAAVVLNRCRGRDPGSNWDVLSRTLTAPLVSIPACPDDDDALADAVELSGLPTLLGFDPADL